LYKIRTCYTVNYMNKNQGIAMPISREILERLQANDPELTKLDLEGNRIGNTEVELLADALKENSILTELNLKGNRIGTAGAKNLAAALKENTTLTKLNLQDNPIEDPGAAHLADALKENTTLTELKLGRILIGTARVGWHLQIDTASIMHLEAALKENTTLTELELGGNHIGAAGAAHLAAALKKNTTLTKLDLWQNQIDDAGAEHLAAALKESTTLTELKLQDNQIGAAGAADLAAALKENTTLTELNLGWNQIDDAGASCLAASLKKNTTLTELNLRDNQIGAAGAADLAAALKENTTLTKLHLVSNQIGAAGASDFAGALKENTTLTKLHLPDNQTGAAGASDFAGALKENTTLTELNLEHNQIDAVGASDLADALKKNTSLTKLYLGSNKIGAAGAEHLAAALKENTTLTTLNLGGNHIDDAGIAHLADALKENSTLTELELWANQIGDAGAEHLAAALKENSTLTELKLGYSGIDDAGDEHLASALKQNYTLLKLNGVSSREIDAFLSRNEHIADCLKLLKDFTTPGLLDFENINETIETLYTLAPELNDEDNPLPEDNYLSEAHRLLCALSSLQGGYLAEALALLESPMRHPQFAIIADKVYAEVLMTNESPEDKAMQVVRYKLLAYCGRHDIHSIEFATGLAGVSVPQGEHPDFELVYAVSSNPRSLPDGACWLNYDELRDLAQSALGQAVQDSDERRLLEAVIAQKDYHPTAVNNCFHSSLFIHALRTAYPHQDTFQCLEGYLDLQHIEGLGGVYALPTEDDEAILTPVIADLDNAPRIETHTYHTSLTTYLFNMIFAQATFEFPTTSKPYACVQDEITGLKQLMTLGFELSSRDEDGLESKENDVQPPEASTGIDGGSGVSFEEAEGVQNNMPPAHRTSDNDRDTICLGEFKSIVDGYKSTSLLGDIGKQLSTIWFLSWMISPTRSNTMLALQTLLKESEENHKDSISKEDINQAIEQSESGWFSSKHRTSLFRHEGDVENNHTSTDEVVEQLANHFKNK
jgi:Ran GTPase-activating protein (RanGAP) involved in mRNA processing and transport